MDATKGTIGVLTTEQSRFSRFWGCLCTLDTPGQTRLIFKYSLNVAEARNQILEEAEGDWVWFIDDDHTFRPDILRKLWERDVDLVQPVVLARYSPFAPVHMGKPLKDNPNKHWRYALLPQDPHGLKKVYSIGAAGMLIRRRVWEKIPKPWFEMGQLDPTMISEDVYFCRKARQWGFELFTDLEVSMGHLNVGEVWPVRKADGSWRTVIRFGNETVAELPTCQPRFRVDEKGDVYDVDGHRVPPGASLDPIGDRSELVP